MLFSIRRRDKTPVYLQLVDQIRYRIAMDQMQAGQLLPTVRDVANQIGVSIHTVARAYEVLQDQGLITMRQGQRAKVMPLKEHSPSSIPFPMHSNHLEHKLREIWEEAQQSNISATTFKATVNRLISGEESWEPKLVFIECNRPESTQCAAQITRELTAVATPVLLEDLLANPEGTLEQIGRPMAAVTTFFHINQVKTALATQSIPTLGVVLALQPGLLIQIATLASPANRIAVVCRDPESTTTLVSLVKEVGFADHQLAVMLSDNPNLPDLLNCVDGAVVSPAALEITQKYLPKGRPAIGLTTQISTGSVSLLAQELKLSFRKPSHTPEI